MTQRIYLAGPDVFLADASDIGRRKQAICAEFGFEGLFPLDKDPKAAGDAATIFRANCALMRKADIGLFNLTPFRGPSADAGTIFELGYMTALGKPVHGYSAAPAAYRARIAAAAGAGIALRDAEGYEIEDFGLADNLMIVRAIIETGGELAAIEETTGTGDAPPLAAFRAFRACLESLSRRSDLGKAKRSAAQREG
jgi:nucleoside 2-deoxyribosyltransferase